MDKPVGFDNRDRAQQRDAVVAAILADLSRQATLASRMFHWLAESSDLPAHPYLLGLKDLASHNAQGHDAYLLGEVSRQGWWYYFPVAFAVKTPTARLLGWLLAAFCFSARYSSHRDGGFGGYLSIGSYSSSRPLCLWRWP